jgi:hypothetical protein
MTTPGELLSITTNRAPYGEMNVDERMLCDKMHALMSTALAKMPLLRQNNNCLSLAPVDQSYLVHGTNRYFVPLENAEDFDLSEEQYVEARRNNVHISCSRGQRVLSMQAPSLRSAMQGSALPSSSSKLSIGAWFSTLDLLVLIMIVVAVTWYYRSPRQLTLMLEQFVVANWRPVH